MSLVVAVHNKKNIVIGYESLSMITRADGQRSPDSTIQKVKRVNSGLALMITGSYMSDKLQFTKDYVVAAKRETDLIKAFVLLDEMAKDFNIYKSENFRVGLAGFTSGAPRFRCITFAHGQEKVLEEATANYYLSGEYDPVKLVEEHLKNNSALKNNQLNTHQLEVLTRKLVDECIDKFGDMLGGPVHVLRLSNKA